MKFKKIMFAGALVFGMIASFAFKADSKRFAIPAYYVGGGNACVSGWTEQNDCNEVYPGVPCTILVPTSGGLTHKPAYRNSPGPTICVGLLRQFP